jgi:hypothetical protein
MQAVSIALAVTGGCALAAAVAIELATAGPAGRCQLRRSRARSCPPGAAWVTTTRAKPAAPGDTDDGCHRRIYAAVSPESIQDLYCRECARHRTPAAKMTACRPPRPSGP